MQRALGLALLTVGIVLLVFGINSSHSFSSQLSDTLRGTPTDRTVWFYIGAAVAGIPGLFLVVTSRSRPK